MKHAFTFAGSRIDLVLPCVLHAVGSDVLPFPDTSAHAIAQTPERTSVFLAGLPGKQMQWVVDTLNANAAGVTTEDGQHVSHRLSNGCLPAS